jgi:uroporphyrinogen-III synthase
MRVLVTRPAREAESTARRLQARGHQAVVAPVLEIVRTGFTLPEGPFDAVLATRAWRISRCMWWARERRPSRKSEGFGESRLQRAMPERSQ